MKKIGIILAFVFLLALSLSSCRSTRPPCPAYQASNTIQVDNQNIAK